MEPNNQNTQLTDYLGKVINVGDKVVIATAHGRNSGASFTQGVVVRLTEKTVFYNGSGVTNFERERKCSPDKIIVINNS